MIKRYEQCIGLSFPAIGRYKLEFWFCPRNYRIPQHSHPQENIKLMFLFGNNIKFWKGNGVSNKSFLARWYHIGRIFNIHPGENHYFEVNSCPLVFLNLEIWNKGIKPTSASEDFQLSNRKELHATPK